MIKSIIPFYEDKILSIKNEHTGEIYVSMKHVCQSIPIDWTSQCKKLKENGKYTDRYHVWGCRRILVPIKGVDQETYIIPVKNINGWLLQLNPKHLRSDKARQKLIRYQKECFQVLYDYWNKGSAVNPRKSINPFDAIDGDLTNPETSKKIVEVFQAFHEANVERYKVKKKLAEVLGSTKSKLVKDVWAELNVTYENGDPVPVEECYSMLRDLQYFRKHRDIPYQQFSNDQMFGKVELPKTGPEGTRIIINAALNAGFQIRNPKISQLLITSERTKQKMLPLTQTAVILPETERTFKLPTLKDFKENSSSNLESEPVFIHPFASKTMH